MCIPKREEIRLPKRDKFEYDLDVKKKGKVRDIHRKNEFKLVSFGFKVTEVGVPEKLGVIQFFQQIKRFLGINLRKFYFVYWVHFASFFLFTPVPPALLTFQ